MLKKILSCFTLPLLLFFLNNSSGDAAPGTMQSAPEGFNQGPDIITGEVGEAGGLEQFGSSGTQVGLGVSTTSCNAGNVPVNFFVMPNTNHPIIPHNLYRMSGGPSNNDRFEQIGQSWVKHAFGADQLDDCGFGCLPGGSFTRLGAGCSDTYANFQNATQGDLGSRALVNPQFNFPGAAWQGPFDRYKPAPGFVAQGAPPSLGRTAGQQRSPSMLITFAPAPAA